MESSLHRDLKLYYASRGGQCEVPVDRYRTDVVCGDQLIEIQQASMVAIRSKLRDLLSRGHTVVLVKPAIHRKKLVQLSSPGGTVLYQRYSPRRYSWWEVFAELVYIAPLLAHPGLVLDIVECDIEEWRCAAGRRRRRPWHRSYRLVDQRLLAIHTIRRFTSRNDYRAALPVELDEPFDSLALSRALNIPRWLSQKILYVLRHTGAILPLVKRRKGWLYQKAAENAARPACSRSL
ncbi:MAG: hypothetical protein KatS3mg110_1565 [Pirellulaceae bacterium]|nr:MAG: hypothetical protein KatS3mg110_1565 [Pirellulaceae bacterium]